MSETKLIKIVGARVHNLKNIKISLPKRSLTTITGPSGSGKSSLAFDTIHVEGQRRYIESLSSYARQFLGQFSPPDVDSITGLSPSIAINQKTSTKNPRSTVGTVTEIYDYMRILFARAGTLYCPKGLDEVKKYTPAQIVQDILKHPYRTKMVFLAPLSFKDKKKQTAKLKSFFSLGLTRYRIDGRLKSFERDSSFSTLKLSSQIELVVDRIILKEKMRKRLTESVEYGLKQGLGDLLVLIDGQEYFFSEKFLSPKSKIVYPELEPRSFSFNSPHGACPKCNGLGESKTFDIKKMILNENVSILEGAVSSLSKKNSFLFKMVKCVAKSEKVNLKLPFNELPKAFLNILFHGSSTKYRYSFESENSVFRFSKKFPGIISWMEKKYNETSSESVRLSLEAWMDVKKCSDCQGRRLGPAPLHTKITGKNIMDICEMSIKDSFRYFQTLRLEGEKEIVAKKPIHEILSRLRFLIDVGLEYLSLDRRASTLSGGESQRIRLATQIGSGLSGVIYVLDEPSIGLHQRDNLKLIKTLKSLRDLGNTVIVVEHDEETMRASDYIVDLGLGAGRMGGNIVAKGTLSGLVKNTTSLTAKYLSGKKAISVPSSRRHPKTFLEIQGAKANNIHNLRASIPLGVFACISGVSGSGKSTFIHEILVPALEDTLGGHTSSILPGDRYQSLCGGEYIDSLIKLDQSPIGRTPHSNPATYTGLFTLIRTLFSQTKESQVRGYSPGRFSFNVKEGRCGACDGHGVKTIEMHFLPDVYITCSECQGLRYNEETLTIFYREKNIADILAMDVDEAKDFFKNHIGITRILETLQSVGLGYMSLGQSATTLSGGEAQRLKLSRELAKKKRGHTFYVLDEPTTGLHFEDISILLRALNKLVDQGNTVVVIEHNMDVIKTADYVIDLGPEGGDSGGNVVAFGTPEDVRQVSESYTGRFLKRCL